MEVPHIGAVVGDHEAGDAHRVHHGTHHDFPQMATHTVTEAQRTDALDFAIRFGLPSQVNAVAGDDGATAEAILDDLAGHDPQRDTLGRAGDGSIAAAHAITRGGVGGNGANGGIRCEREIHHGDHLTETGGRCQAT